jgi:hypothetical protein
MADGSFEIKDGRNCPAYAVHGDLEEKRGQGLYRLAEGVDDSGGNFADCGMAVLLFNGPASIARWLAQ